MDKPVLSPSKISKTPPEKTLKLLHERLDLAEQEARKLSGQLTGYGFQAGVQAQNEGERRSVIETITPFKLKPVDEVQHEILKRDYEQLVTRVCRTESTVQSLKLALVSLEAENSLMSKQSVAGTLSANEAYEKKLTKVKKELVDCRRQLDESERFRAETDQDFEKIRELVGVKSGASSEVVLKVLDLKKTREKLTKRVNELQEELSHEKNIRLGLEDSHKDLLGRVTEMEGIVERENQEMKLLSGDCGSLKQELSNTRTCYEREYQTRMQLEKLVERLNGDLEEMESKLLNISNERKTLDIDLAKFKRENREQRQQLQLLQKSNEKLKEVNLDLEERYKEVCKTLRITEDDNKLLIAKHRDVVEKEKLVFAEKLKDQDRLLDEAKESILQELLKERQAGIEKDKQSLKLKSDLVSSQKFLQEKDVEVMNLKKLLEALTVERDKMMEENEKAIVEIRRDLDNFASEKITLEAAHEQTKVQEFNKKHSRYTKGESKRVTERNKLLEEECQKLETRLMELEHQQTNQNRVNSALENMLEDKRRLAYEKGVLQSQVEQLDNEVASLAQLKKENEKLSYTLSASEKKFNELYNELEENKRKIRRTETDMKKLQSVAADKEKEVKFLIKNKNEALKETERVIRQTDTYGKKYTKKIDSLHKALVQSKEDNMKLASTLETVFTSHTQLQATSEQLQTELGKRDSEAKYTQEERTKMMETISELTNEVEDLRTKLVVFEEGEPNKMDVLHKALEVMEDDREKLIKTVEPLMKTNKELQVSLETLAKEVKKKEGEIKKLRQASMNEKKELKMEKKAKEDEVDEVQKETEKALKEMRMKHKKEIAKLKKEHHEMMEMKNAMKEENVVLKREQLEQEERQKKLKEKLKSTKNQLEQCSNLRTAQEKEIDVARQKIKAMGRELATLENLKSEYTRNNVEQARSLQEFVSQLTDLQEEFQRLSQAQQGTTILCRQKDEEITREKLKRKEFEIQCYKFKDREKHLREMRNNTERKLQEVNYESQQVAANLQEAHEWFKGKFTNLQSELSKSKKIQSILEKDNVGQYKALQDEKRRADEATEKAKEIIKSSRMMISKLVGQAVEVSDESKEIQEAMAKETLKSGQKVQKAREMSSKRAR